MPLVCLSAWKRSGKDTLAGHLIQNYQAEQLSFAGPLKDMAAVEYNIPRNWFDDQDLKESPLTQYPVTPKDAFAAMLADFMIKEFRTGSGQKILYFDKTGPEWLAIAEGDRGELIHTTAFHTPRSLAILKGSTNRLVDPDYWIKKAFDTANEMFKGNPNKVVTVTDLRYKSEVAKVVERFGDKAVIIRIDRFDTSPSSDPSERDLDNYDFKYRIDNRGTLDQAYEQLDKILFENDVIR